MTNGIFAAIKFTRNSIKTLGEHRLNLLQKVIDWFQNCVTVKQNQRFLASNVKNTEEHTHTRSVVGSIVMHLIHCILITVPVCGK